MTLFIGGDQLYARTSEGRIFNLDEPTQPLLVVGEGPPMRPLVVRERRRRAASPLRRTKSPAD